MDEQKPPVFKFVDGKLVRKENDERDPNRRYSSVSGPDGNYLREFTEAEERERDDEEARWEADAPKREAEAKQQEDEAKRFKDSLKYEARIVAFLDVLGWSEAVERSHNDPEFTKQLGLALAGLRAQVKMADWMQAMPGGWPNDPQITQLSDTIILSFLLDHHSDISARSALENGLQWITDTLLQAGLLIRGGIARGALIHQGTIVYGPALLSAYQLESKHGQPPRIILDDNLIAWAKSILIYDQKGNFLGKTQPAWRLDDDGKIFFDFLRPQFLDFFVEKKSDAHHLQRLSHLRSMVVTNLDKYRDHETTFNKYKWLANYFNSICVEYKATEIEQIS